MKCKIENNKTSYPLTIPINCTLLNYSARTLPLLTYRSPAYRPIGYRRHIDDSRRCALYRRAAPPVFNTSAYSRARRLASVLSRLGAGDRRAPPAVRTSLLCLSVVLCRRLGDVGLGPVRGVFCRQATAWMLLQRIPAPVLHCRACVEDPTCWRLTAMQPAHLTSFVISCLSLRN